MSAALAHPLVWAALAALGAIVILWPRGDGPLRASVRERLAPVARMVAFWLIGPVLIVLVAPGLTDDMRGILIAALLAVASWFVTFLFQQEELAADQGDLMIALRAEIWVYLLALRREGSAVHARMVDARIAEALAAGHDYTHFIPIPGEPVVFEAVASRIDRLPTAPVDRIIQFYSLIADIRSFAADLRSDAFAALPLNRRRWAYAHYYDMRSTLEALATVAIHDINVALGVKTPDADLDAGLMSGARVSSPVPGPSAPGSGPDSSVGQP